MPDRRPSTIDVEIHLSAARVGAALLGSVAALAALSLLGAISGKAFGHDSVHGLIPRLDANEEMSLPTWFSSMLLLSIGVLSAVIALLKRQEGDRFTSHWSGLAGVFSLMSMEEIADFHNIQVLSDATTTSISPYLRHSWVILGAACVIVLAATFARFLLALPRETARWMILSGLTYFGGAIGGEMFSGRIVALGGRGSWPLVLVSNLEETLEMLGAVMLIVTLLRYIDATYGRATLRFASVVREAAADDRGWLAGTITPVAPVPAFGQSAQAATALQATVLPPADVPVRRATGE